MAEQHESPQHPVVVGIDGTEQSAQALRYAATEARRRGCGLRLVHAIHETAPLTPMYPFLSMETFAEAGQRIAEEAERTARELAPDLSVETAVVPGAPAGALGHASDHACLVVLGHRDRSLLGRVLTSSTTTGVAARAHCPVVSVPAAWSETDQPEEQQEGGQQARVVVGVDGSSASKDALREAFAEADRRGALLTVLHAWRLPDAYADMVANRTGVDADWRGPATRELEAMTAPGREAHPTVEVDLDLRYQSPAPALVGASEGADLLLLGRRGHGAPLGLYLGSLARTLIREARCPVEVVPHRTPAEVPGQRGPTEEHVTPQR